MAEATQKLVSIRSKEGKSFVSFNIKVGGRKLLLLEVHARTQSREKIYIKWKDGSTTIKHVKGEKRQLYILLGVPHPQSIWIKALDNLKDIDEDELQSGLKIVLKELISELTPKDKIDDELKPPIQVLDSVKGLIDEVEFCVC